MNRMPAERLKKAQEQLASISPEDHEKVKGLAAIVQPLRSFIHKTPDDYGMVGWEDVVIQSDDGTPLEGWYIPAAGGEGEVRATSSSFSTTHYLCAAQAFPDISASLGVILMR